MRKKAFVSFVLLVAATGSGLFLSQCSREKPDSGQAEAKAATYLGDASCAGCHNNEHTEWLSSHHYMAMLPAHDTTVLGDFNNATLTADGVTSRFFKRDGKFYINTEGEDGINRDFEVKYTFGFTPLQQYLVEFPGGRMQVPRVSWDVKSRKWYHQYAGQHIPAHDWMHWTGNSQNWNTMCASCHSTNLQKNYDWASDTYNTTYNIINVSCESCHGPGSAHVELVSSSNYKKGSGNGAFILLGKNSDQNTTVNACGLCHARKTDITGAVNAGDAFLDDFIPQTPTTDFFHADGQMNDEVYNYTSFLQSKMHRRGIKCTDCHNPHSGKLILSGNLMCGKCHEPAKYDVPSHTFHKTGTAASECKSCHMYSKEYMGNDLRHDHSFRVPRPDLSAQFGTPNTCNSCHKEKTAKWAAEAIVKWYGPTRAHHFADDLIPGSRLDENSYAHLQRLLNDSTAPGIIKATAAEYLGNIPTQESLESLLACLSHTDAHVRYRALRSLDSFDPSYWINAVSPLLSDPVRAVRIAAADLFTGMNDATIPSASGDPLSRAQGELEHYILYQTDFAVGNSNAGDYYSKKQHFPLAEQYYRRALRMDSLMNYARLNLSAVQSSQGNNQEALKTLNEAIATDPVNDRAYYNKALLLAEMNDFKGASVCFEKAISLNTANPRVYYNYGILLQQSGDIKKATSVYLKGLQKDRVNGELNYALAALYINTGDSIKAKAPVEILQRYHSGNPAFSSLLKRYSKVPVN